MSETVVKNSYGLEIKVGGTYINSLGLKFKVICNDRNHKYSIVYITNDGDLCTSGLLETGTWKEYDLVNDLNVDDKVFVRHEESDNWTPRHFAQLKFGKVFVFGLGRSSFTNEERDLASFKYWKKAD